LQLPLRVSAMPHVSRLDDPFPKCHAARRRRIAVARVDESVTPRAILRMG
jgi:hypothetical protein